MLTGNFPFDGKNDDDIQYKIISEHFKFPSNITISKSGFRLVSALLEKNQHLRIETNDALFDEWYNDE
jgi:serine/threonine protein kinase